MLWDLAISSDLVIANTIVEVKAIRALNGAPVPVLWWLHDAFVGYGYLSHLIPRTLERNIRVCAVGSHATAAMHTHRPDFEIGQLVYGLPGLCAGHLLPLRHRLCRGASPVRQRGGL